MARKIKFGFLMAIIILTAVNFYLLRASKEGIIREYYLNDKLKGEYSYRDGKLEGISKEYYESGPLASARQFKDGKRHGYSRIFYENGKLQFEGAYKAGKYITGKEFTEEGIPRSGLNKEYYPGGGVWEETNYKDGKLDGVAKVYYEDGKIKEESTYKDGKLLNEKEFAQNGRLIGEKNY